jgi:hypothetical protein
MRTLITNVDVLKSFSRAPKYVNARTGGFQDFMDFTGLHRDTWSETIAGCRRGPGFPGRRSATAPWHHGPRWRAAARALTSTIEREPIADYRLNADLARLWHETSPFR